AADSVVLSVSFLGYVAQTLRLTIHDELHVAIALTPTTIQGEEEVVSDERAPIATGSHRHVLTTKEIVAVPALLGEWDVLRTRPFRRGVQGGSQGTASILRRGGRPDQNLVLLDGAVVCNPVHLSGLVSTFNPAVIPSVSMTTGAFPALSGGRLSS